MLLVVTWFSHHCRLPLGSLAPMGALLALLVSSSAAAAQAWNADVTLGSGYASYHSSIELSEASAGDRAVRLRGNPYLNAQLGYWLGPRLGVRINSSYTQTDVLNADTVRAGERPSIWKVAGDVLVRIRTPDQKFIGLEVLPYAAVGAGLNSIGEAVETCRNVAAGRSFRCHPFNVQSERYALEESTAGMLTLALGSDWRVGRRVALRTEVGDRIWKIRAH